MTASVAVQEAKKMKQSERLDKKADIKTAKDSKAYAEWYANQPMQKVRAAANAKYQAARKSLREANDTLAVAEITGEGLEQANHDQQVAQLVAERSKPAPRGKSTAGLGGD